MASKSSVLHQGGQGLAARVDLVAGVRPDELGCFSAGPDRGQPALELLSVAPNGAAARKFSRVRFGRKPLAQVCDQAIERMAAGCQLRLDVSLDLLGQAMNAALASHGSPVLDGPGDARLTVDRVFGHISAVPREIGKPFTVRALFEFDQVAVRQVVELAAQFQRRGVRIPDWATDRIGPSRRRWGARCSASTGSASAAIRDASGPGQFACYFPSNTPRNCRFRSSLPDRRAWPPPRSGRGYSPHDARSARPCRAASRGTRVQRAAILPLQPWRIPPVCPVGAGPARDWPRALFLRMKAQIKMALHLRHQQLARTRTGPENPSSSVMSCQTSNSILTAPPAC